MDLGCALEGTNLEHRVGNELGGEGQCLNNEIAEGQVCREVNAVSIVPILADLVVPPVVLEVIVIVVLVLIGKHKERHKAHQYQEEEVECLHHQ